MAASKFNHTFSEFGALSRIMDVSVLVLNAEGNIEFSSSSVHEMLGDGEELKNHWAFIKPLLNLDRQDGKVSKPLRFAVDIPHSMATRFLALEVHALDEGTSRGYLVFLRDRRSADPLETEFLLASQMRAVAFLSDALIHDVKSPLHAMHITLELLSDIAMENSAGASADKDGARHSRYVRVLKEELLRLNRNLQVALNQNVPLGKHSQVFDLRELIQEIAGLVGAQARRQHVDLQVHLPEQSMAIDGYRDRLRQALLNIVIRSLEAMRQGGELLIDAVVRNGVADISFEDDGVYLPADALNERGRAYFVSAKTADKASMYVTRLVVESHGGEIFLEDKVGQGARIKLTLPLDREKLLAQFIAHGAKYDRKVE